MSSGTSGYTGNMEDLTFASRCRWLSGVSSVGFAALAATPSYGAGGLPGSDVGVPAPRLDVRARTEFAFAPDHVLGASLVLLVRADGPGEARGCDRCVMPEIQSLRLLLSTDDGGSAISHYIPVGTVSSPD